MYRIYYDIIQEYRNENGGYCDARIDNNYLESDTYENLEIVIDNFVKDFSDKELERIFKSRYQNMYILDKDANNLKKGYQYYLHEHKIIKWTSPIVKICEDQFDLPNTYEIIKKMVTSKIIESHNSMIELEEKIKIEKIKADEEKDKLEFERLKKKFENKN